MHLYFNCQARDRTVDCFRLWITNRKLKVSVQQCTCFYPNINKSIYNKVGLLLILVICL